MRPHPLTALLLAAALVLGACSGEESATPQDTAPAATAGAESAPGAAGSEQPTEAAGGEQRTEPAELEPSPPFDVATLTLVPPEAEAAGDADAVSLPVLVAAEREARQQGLMGREDLPDGTGMVFLFPQPSTSGFWMKNTLIPLSIAFYGEDGEILAILDMEPCEADPCPSYDPEVTYRGAIEVEQGWFDEVGVEEGWHVEVPPGLPSAT